MLRTLVVVPELLRRFVGSHFNSTWRLKSCAREFSPGLATFLSKTSTFAITRSRSTRSYSGWVQINIQQHSYIFYIFFSSNSSGARSSDPKQLGVCHILGPIAQNPHITSTQRDRSQHQHHQNLEKT